MYSYDALVSTSNSFKKEVILGTVQLGREYGRANITGKPSRLEALAILDYAFSQGIHHFDTARIYGDAEDVLGDFLKMPHIKNSSIITKLKPIADILEDSVSNVVRLEIDKSRDILGLKQLDFVLLHDWKNKISHNGDVWSQLLKLSDEGVIGQLGSTVYTPEQAIWALSDANIKIIQLPFNILDKRWDTDQFLNALSLRPDVKIHVRSILLQGVLQSDAPIWPAIHGLKTHDVISKINFLVQALHRDSIIDLCFAYVAGKHWVDALVIGVDTLAQLEQNIVYLNKPVLTFDEIQYVEKIIEQVPPDLLTPYMWTAFN